MEATIQPILDLTLHVPSLDAHHPPSVLLLFRLLPRKPSDGVPVVHRPRRHNQLYKQTFCLHDEEVSNHIPQGWQQRPSQKSRTSLVLTETGIR